MIVFCETVLINCAKAERCGVIHIYQVFFFFFNYVLTSLMFSSEKVLAGTFCCKHHATSFLIRWECLIVLSVLLFTFEVELDFHQ